MNKVLWRSMLAAMLAFLAVVAYWPSPVDQPVRSQLNDALDFLQRHGLPGWFNYGVLEASANVVLFVPLGFATGLAFTGTRWWQTGALGLLVSGCIELGQLLFLHGRFASPVDIATNSTGAVLGALGALLVLRRAGARCLLAADPR